MAPDCCAGAYHLAEQQQPFLLEREGVAKCAKGVQKAHFPKGQKNNTMPLPARKLTWSRRHHLTTLTNDSTSLQRYVEHNCTHSLPGLLILTPTATTGWR